MFGAANVGSADRLIRIVLGALLIAAPYFYASSLWDSSLARWGVPIVGAVLAITAFIRFCPLYRITGASTSK